jgi:hypothetical protein
VAPCVSWVLSPFRRVCHGSPNAEINGHSFICIRHSSPRFIGVAEVVTEVEMHPDAGSSKQTIVNNLRLGLRSNWLRSQLMGVQTLVSSTT